MPRCLGALRSGTCGAPPHYLVANDSGSVAVQCCTASGQWVVALLQYTAALPLGHCAVQCMWYIATLLGGPRQWNSLGTLPYCFRAVSSGCRKISTAHCPMTVRLSTTAVARPIRSFAAEGSGAPLVHSHLAFGQWALELLRYTTRWLGGSGQRRTAWGHSGLELLPYIVVVLGAIGSGTPSLHHRPPLEQWDVELPRYSLSLPWGSDPWIFAVDYCIALAQWAMELLRYIAPMPTISGNRICPVRSLTA